MSETKVTIEVEIFSVVSSPTTVVLSVILEKYYLYTTVYYGDTSVGSKRTPRIPSKES